MDLLQAAAERFGEEARLMIRAMITAAYADGSLSQDERGRILKFNGACRPPSLPR